MNILITGAKGFIGRNLIATLHNIADGKDRSFGMDADITIYEYDIDTDPALLDVYCKNADFVFNLAGVNRPQDPKEFMEGNFGFASTLLDTLKKYNNNCPIMISSSTIPLLSVRLLLSIFSPLRFFPSAYIAVFFSKTSHVF